MQVLLLAAGLIPPLVFPFSTGAQGCVVPWEAPPPPSTGCPPIFQFALLVAAFAVTHHLQKTVITGALIPLLLEVRHPASTDQGYLVVFPAWFLIGACPSSCSYLGQ